MANLRGKAAVVTGAGRGLGLAYARDLAAAGAHVVVNDIDEAAGIIGQAIGVGGDQVTLWSHPSQVASAFADAGRSADALAETWPTTFGPHIQSVSEPIPQPEEQRA